jgi:hypothetical protein
MAARRAAELRRATANETVERLFTILELRPRIESSLIANVFVAFVDGLAVDAGLSVDAGNAATSRVAFDVFWLAMLSLAE